ncbi:hypothetical protein LT493_44240 [Streptomyces tricolor]|nr:hypothetical protein [Streptomyces tricolor]
MLSWPTATGPIRAAPEYRSGWISHRLPQGRGERHATVVAWHPADDIARSSGSTGPVAGTAPLPWPPPTPRCTAVRPRLYGFPESTDTGVNAHASCARGQGRGPRHPAGRGTRQRRDRRPGFSGGPVWDVETRHVGRHARHAGPCRTRRHRLPDLRPARLGRPGAGRPRRPRPLQGAASGGERRAPVHGAGRGRRTRWPGRSREQPLTLLTGQSGTGKSSPLHAGLLPRPAGGRGRRRGAHPAGVRTARPRRWARRC